MIVGKGMVAGAIKDIAGWENDILFSSGVSNSGEQDRSAFQKEIDLILQYFSFLKAGAAFVYFSTTSIFDSSKSNSPYILHKLYIESLLKKSGINYLIIRLPNLVGASSNPHTLTNYFANNIREHKPIKLKSDAVRHLIDVSDLSFILNNIKSKFGKQNLTVNVETDRPLTAGQILSLLEEAMSAKAEIIPHAVENSGKKASAFKDTSSLNYTWETGENYHKDMFRKYYSG